jgi:plastocyanin
MRSSFFSALVSSRGWLMLGTVVVLVLVGPVPADGRDTRPPALMDAPTAVAGKTVTVNMLGDAKGFRFEPSNITVSNGDVIKFVNVSGGPHNVAFYPDKIPAAAKSALSAALPNQLSSMTGPFVTTPNGTYTMTFAKVPPGKYDYFCTPHLALGMKGVITVK